MTKGTKTKRELIVDKVFSALTHCDLSKFDYDSFKNYLTETAVNYEGINRIYFEEQDGRTVIMFDTVEGTLREDLLEFVALLTLAKGPETRSKTTDEAP